MSAESKPREAPLERARKLAFRLQRMAQDEFGNAPKFAVCMHIITSYWNFIREALPRCVSCRRLRCAEHVDAAGVCLACRWAMQPGPSP